MVIDFLCPGCGKNYKADASFAGRKMRCKQCGALVPIPAPISAVQPAAPRPNGTPPRTSHPSPPRPKPRPAPAPDDEVYDLSEDDLVDRPVPVYAQAPLAAAPAKPSPASQWTEADWPSDGPDVRKQIILGAGILVGVIVAGVSFVVVRNATRNAGNGPEIAAADIPDEAPPAPQPQPKPKPTEVAKASPPEPEPAHAAAPPDTSAPPIPSPRSTTAGSWASYLQAQVRYLNALADAFATIRDEPSSKTALPRIESARKQFESEGKEPATRVLTASEKTDLWNQQGSAFELAANRVLDELERIQAIPGHSPSVERSFEAFDRFRADAEQLLNPDPPATGLMVQYEARGDRGDSLARNDESPAEPARPQPAPRPRAQPAQPSAAPTFAETFDRETQRRRDRLDADLHAIDEAIAALNSPNSARYRPAIIVLKDKGPVASKRAKAARGLEKAIKALWNPRDTFLMGDMSVALAKWSGKDDVPTLIRLLDRERWGGRAELVRALGNYKEPRVLDALLDYLGKEGAVFDVLRKDGPQIEHGVLAQLKKRDPAVRRDVCRLLREIGTSACLDELDSVAREDSDEGVHREAENALRTIREKQLRLERDAAEIDRALGILKSSDTARYRQAVNTLKTKEPNAERAQVAAGLEKAVEALWKPQDGFLMADLSVALAKWGGPENVPTLVKMLDRERWMGRREIIDGLARIKDPSAIAPMLELLGKEGAVVEALRAFGADAERKIRPYLENPDPAVRRDASRALELIGTAASLSALEDLVRNDPDVSVQQHAANAVRVIDERAFKEQ